MMVASFMLRDNTLTEKRSLLVGRMSILAIPMAWAIPLWRRMLRSDLRSRLLSVFKSVFRSETMRSYCCDKGPGYWELETASVGNRYWSIFFTEILGFSVNMKTSFARIIINSKSPTMAEYLKLLRSDESLASLGLSLCRIEKLWYSCVDSPNSKGLL